MERIGCAVIGAGVVGLAVARALARGGRAVVILEAADAIGTGTSSRNSEVIHAGLYYPTGSLKARTCVAGRAALYAFCAAHGVPCRRLGKLIVATAEQQRPRLEALAAQAVRNGVDNLVPLTAGEVRALEPALACVAALLSPSTGILDSHAFMLALLGEAEDHGAVLACRSRVEMIRLRNDGLILDVAVDGGEGMKLAADVVVNAAGLEAQALAARTEGLAPALIPRRHLAKGHYFALSGVRTPFARLVYPVPEDGGLGVHLTLDMGGQARFGPDVEWVDGIDYAVPAARGDRFYAAIRQYWPALPDGALVPAYAGVRPKLSGPGEPAADFVIQGPRAHGIAGLVNLFGIESPGLTAALALADAVVDCLADGG